MDINDRPLRNTIVALGNIAGGLPRKTGFNITEASEVMAILCQSLNLQDLKDKFSRIYIGDRLDGSPVFAHDLNAQGAMATLMKDAIKPNFVQTLEHNPAIIHGGPFANIAQGTNSIIATKMGMSLSEFVVTEGDLALIWELKNSSTSSAGKRKSHLKPWSWLPLSGL